MGFLTRKLDERKRFWIGLVKDIVLIIIILYFVFNNYYAFNDGFWQGYNRCMERCFIGDMELPELKAIQSNPYNRQDNPQSCRHHNNEYYCIDKLN